VGLLLLWRHRHGTHRFVWRCVDGGCSQAPRCTRVDISARQPRCIQWVPDPAPHWLGQGARHEDDSAGPHNPFPSVCCSHRFVGRVDLLARCACLTYSCSCCGADRHSHAVPCACRRRAWGVCACSRWARLGRSPLACSSEQERGTVRAAHRSGVIHVLSSLATNTIEQVAAAAPDANRWFQVCVRGCVCLCVCVCVPVSSSVCFQCAGCTCWTVCCAF